MELLRARYDVVYTSIMVMCHKFHKLYYKSVCKRLAILLFELVSQLYTIIAKSNEEWCRDSNVGTVQECMCQKTRGIKTVK